MFSHRSQPVTRCVAGVPVPVPVPVPVRTICHCTAQAMPNLNARLLRPPDRHPRMHFFFLIQKKKRIKILDQVPAHHTNYDC